MIHSILLIELDDTSLLRLLYEHELFVNPIDHILLTFVKIGDSRVNDIELFLKDG